MAPVKKMLKFAGRWQSAFIVAIAIGVASCSSSHELNTAGTRTSDVNQAYPIGAEMRRVVLDVPQSNGDAATESDAYFAVTAFVRHYIRDGRGQLSIATASRGASAIKGGRAAQIIHSVLRANGVALDRVRYVERRDGLRQTTLSYFRVVAVAPTRCDDWSEDISRRPELGPYKTFGCASQRNLANMVADPTDLVTPAVEADRGSDRMSTTYKSYSTTVSGTTGAR